MNKDVCIYYVTVVSFCLFVCLFAAAGAYRVDPCLLLC